MRTSIIKFIDNPVQFKQLVLTWSQQFREVVFLDSNDYPQQYSSYDCILAVDAFTSIKTDFHNAFEDLKQYQQISKDWLFGYLSYDLKNDIEILNSNNFDGLNFPDLFFFQPKKLFLLKGNQLEIQYLNFCDDEIEEDFFAILETQLPKPDTQYPIIIKQRISKEDYIKKVSKILMHIHRGDIYEANFCMEYFAENAIIKPLEKFLKLNEISKSPQAVFLKIAPNFCFQLHLSAILRKKVIYLFRNQ